MPQLDLFTWTVWLANIATQTALTIIILKKDEWKKWKALFSFILFQTIIGYFLLATALGAFPYQLTPKIYFYSYWASSSIASILLLWVLIDILQRQLLTQKHLIRNIVIALTVGTGVLCALMIKNEPIVYDSKVTHLAVLLDRSISFAWLASFFSVSSCLKAFDVAWVGRTARIALGSRVFASGKLLSALLCGLLPNTRLVSNLCELCYFFALAIWVDEFLRNEEKIIDPPSIEKLRFVIQALLDAVQKVRAK